jgi:hypothetical protein
MHGKSCPKNSGYLCNFQKTVQNKRSPIGLLALDLVRNFKHMLIIVNMSPQNFAFFELLAHVNVEHFVVEL